MSLSNSRFLDVRKLTTKDIIDIIKNDELFSSCCKIIEEKDLNGQDILNLTEKQILAWKPPQWLTRNLLLLKSSISKNPEIFLNPQGDNTIHSPNLRNESMLKQPESKHYFQSQNEAANKYLSFDHTQDENGPFYDEHNYLEPIAINASVKIKTGFGKPLLKLPPSTESNSTKFGKDRSKSPSSFRNPIPPPREDIEENVYEPAPNSTHITNTTIQPSYSTSISLEEDDYEPPPILPHKFQYQDASKFYTNNSIPNIRSVKDSSDKLERKYTNTEMKKDFPPQLPVRTLTLQKQIKREYSTRKTSNYTNVVNGHISEEDSVHEIISRNKQRKYSLTPMKDELNVVLPETSKDQKSWTLDRPLPPLPRRNSMNESRMDSSGKNKFQDGKIHNEELKYYSLRQTSFPAEILKKSRSIEDSSIPLKSDFLQELRTSNIPQLKHVSKNNEFSNHNAGSYGGISENNNNQETMKPATSNSNSEHKLNSNLLSEIFKVKLKSKKYSEQRDKTTNNDEMHKSPSKLTDTEEVTKPFKLKPSFQSTGKPVSSKLKVNPMISPSETKFRSLRTTVNTRENPVGRSADENETMVEYINTEEAQRSKVRQTNTSVLKITTQKTNTLNSKIKSIPTKSSVSSKDSFSDEENVGDLPEYVNNVEICTNKKNLTQKLADNLQDGNTTEININKEDIKTNSAFKTISAPTLKSNTRNSNLSIFSDLSSKISAVKLKPTTFQPQNKQLPLDDMIDNDEILPEYANKDELRSVVLTKLKKTIQNTNTSSLVRETNSFIHEVDSQQACPITGRNQFSSDENDTEDLPEYGNQEEIINFAKQPSVDGSRLKTSTTHETARQSPFSNLLSAISKVKLKPTNYNVLDDTAAEILKQKLLERKNRNTEDQKEKVTNYNNTSKPYFKLALPPSTLPNEFSDDYLENTTQENSEEEIEDTYDEYDGLYNLNNEKYYRNTDRKGARLLLKGLEDGAFVLRPSTEKRYFLSITVKNRNKYYNLGIMQSANQYIFCGEGTMRTPEFPSIKEFLEYFETNPFVFQGEEGVERVYLKKVLPDDRF